MEKNIFDTLPNEFDVNKETGEVKEPKTPQKQELTPKQEIAKAIADKNVSDSIITAFSKLSEQAQLTIPNGYNLGNEVKLAMYEIQANGFLQNCTRESIANAISEMAVQGLSISRKQGYFIAYAGKLSFQRSYFGDVALAKRTNLVVDIQARVIYKGDIIETGTDDKGLETVIKHESSFGNQDNEILGAYAWATGINGYKMYCIMTMKQIQKNFDLSKDSTRKFQNNFKSEACKRTVIRRLVKMIFNTEVQLTEEQLAVINAYNNFSSDYEDSDEKKYRSVEQANKDIQSSIGKGQAIDVPFDVD